MKIISTISTILISVFVINAQSFSELAEFKNFGHILYEPSITEVINIISNEDDFTVYQLIKTKIKKNTDDYYLITFDYGPSEDHTYNIYRVETSGNLKHIGEIGAEKLVIPGNGYVYCSGINNQLYDKKRKFELKGESMSEVDQGAYYIGLKTKTNTLITLYSDINKSSKTAVLPKGYDIEVLIEKDNCILIKTPFGLTGWVCLNDIITYDMTGESLSIKDFYYSGD